jgi:Terminase RNaseH-like domain
MQILQLARSTSFDIAPITSAALVSALRVRLAYATEPGIMEMLQRMRTGRLKVAAHLSEWFGEFRNYHRKDGLVVKLNDDLMSATRIAIMMRRYARTGPLGNVLAPRRREVLMARNVDFNVLG